MAERLRDASSPYLLQHADNPVDWWPWGPEAFAEASRRDVPVLLSIGYASCHWCHVMAHESFEDPDVAAYLDEHFVSIKVDREERPDVDSVYVAVASQMTGLAGWPLTCVLTPDADAFWAGTYLPPEPRRGSPSLMQVLTAAVRAWEGKGDQVRATARAITDQLVSAGAADGEAVTVTRELTEQAVSELAARYDAEHGGFDDGPQFPPSLVLGWLLDHHRATGSEQAFEMVTATAEHLGRSAVFDQVCGGFARYAVDRAWVVPHFEKMLYDNALLLGVYARLATVDPRPAWRRVADQTADFVLRELAVDGGGLAAGLDADVEGVEGGHCTWTRSQLDEVLGQADGPWAADLLEVTESGTFEDGRSTPQLLRDPDDGERWDDVQARLRAARAERVQPARDDKIVTAWNGLAIDALARTGMLLERPDLVSAAAACASYVVRVHLADGRLCRASRRGAAGSAPGVLEDYACLAQGLLTLHQATADGQWLTSALELLGSALRLFADDTHVGVLHDTAADSEQLLRRPRDLTDGATPCGSSALAAALRTAALLAPAEQSSELEARADKVLGAGLAEARRFPRHAGKWLSVAEAHLHGLVQVAIAGTEEDDVAGLWRTALRHTPPGAVVVAGPPDAPGVPLLELRPTVDGAATAYVCHDHVCGRPVTSTDELLSIFDAVSSSGPTA